MFLSASQVTMSLSSAPTTGSRPIPLHELDEEALQVLFPQRQRGILGFRTNDDDEEEHDNTLAPQRRFSASRLFSSRSPSNVNADVWNKAAQRQQGGIWQTSETLTWFPRIPNRMQIESLKVDELRHVCRDRGLTAGGKKEDLQARLLTWADEQLRYKRQSLQFQDWDAADPTVVDPRRPNSLAEWARTVDLDPLLQRRSMIHREKAQGKSVPKTTRPRQESLKIEDLTKAFTSSTSTNNIQVKQLYAAAKLADQQGDADLSKQILLQLKGQTPGDARVYRRIARLEKESGNLSAARSVLQEGLRRHPRNGFLWHGLGQMAANDQDAKKYWRKAMEVDPSLPHPYHALGTLQHTQGHVALAMKTLKTGVQYCPTNHRLHHALGDLYRDAKMLDMAALCYRKALQHGPPVSLGFAYTALAYVDYEQGDVNGCRGWLRKAVSLNSGRHANGWLALAQMEESEGNLDAARAVCIAGLAQYERGLLERSRKIKFRKNKLSLDEDPVMLKNKFLKSVPSYRSGDRFFNVYRNWARLEERYGTIESVEEVYERATLAFPYEWKLYIDWAQYYAKVGIHDRARATFVQACAAASNRHASPYRLAAEFEMSLGKYTATRKILYRGAMIMTQVSDGSSGNHNGLAELFHTWAVCEWHLDDTSRAEVLFDHALRMTDGGQDGSRLRSYILYSIARLEQSKGEHVLAQHCIGLCLKENLMPGGNSKIWDLWADVAAAMGNRRLQQECLDQAANARSHEDENGPKGLARLLVAAGNGGLARLKGVDMQGLLRRDPWHHKIFGTDQPSSFFHGVRLPGD